MNAKELIRKKRDGGELAREEIFGFVQSYTRGEIPDYQASSLLMAVFLRGLSARETADLTEAMMRSGRVLAWPAIPQPKVDKHSTGGVGDKTSLIIAPVAAAGGLAVPMISGRGLGHTGGTLDKLDSIPGFNSRLAIEEFHRVVGACGLGLIGQTDDLAPADRKLYALRDVTATVESIPLIAASIMSKKLAEGLDGLVLDVKTGSGAFMKSLQDSRALAERMVEIGVAHGKRVQALITEMNQPLGNAVGNALEVVECIEALKGRGPRDLMELCRELTAVMFVLGGVETEMEGARRRFDALLRTGQGLGKFSEVIEAQGGDPRILDHYELLPRAEQRDAVVAWQDGYLARIEAEAVGRAAMALGAGRARLDSAIDPAVGIVFEKKVGDPVSAGERICEMHWNEGEKLRQAKAILRSALVISAQAVQPGPLILASVPETFEGRSRA